MGSYGIGVSRAVAAIAEVNCDDRGLVWPKQIAPAQVHLIATGKAGDPQLPAAETLATSLEAAGISVLLDDRIGLSMGVKFNDAELLGMPVIVVVGRGLADGVIELKDRRSGDRRDIALADAVAEIGSLLATLP
jgi:prolyl-tRNA synthetase